MPKKITKKTKKPKKVTIKQKQRQSVNVKINIDNSKKTRPRKATGGGGGSGGGSGSTVIPTFHTFSPSVPYDTNELRSINDGLTTGFSYIKDLITKTKEQPTTPINNNVPPPLETILKGSETGFKTPIKLSDEPVIFRKKKAKKLISSDDDEIPEPFKIPEPLKIQKPIKIRRAGANRVRNPRTGKPVNVGGNIYNKLKKEGLV